MVPVIYDLVAESHLEDAIRLEVSGLPADEAASLQTFKYRQSFAPELFLGAYTKDDNPRLIGYICATASDGDTLTRDSMTNHLPSGRTVCIHSICIDSQHRRQNVATGLIAEYLNRVNEARKYERVLLIVHEKLIYFGERNGFDLVGSSDVVHGSEPWFQMQHLVPPDPTMPPGLLKMLMENQTLKSQEGPRTSKRDLLSLGSVSAVANEEGMNKFDMLCPRPGCNSIVLKPETAKLTQRRCVQLDDPERLPPHDILPHLPLSNNYILTWKIGPPANPMVFENIGFSQDVLRSEPFDSNIGPPVDPLDLDDDSNVTRYEPPVGYNEKITKFFACAECDLGPLGWCEDGLDGKIYWIVCNRVRYKS